MAPHHRVVFLGPGQRSQEPDEVTRGSRTDRTAITGLAKPTCADAGGAGDRSLSARVLLSMTGPQDQRRPAMGYRIPASFTTGVGIGSPNASCASRESEFYRRQESTGPQGLVNDVCRPSSVGVSCGIGVEEAAEQHKGNAVVTAKGPAQSQPVVVSTEAPVNKGDVCSSGIQDAKCFSRRGCRQDRHAERLEHMPKLRQDDLFIVDNQRGEGRTRLLAGFSRGLAGGGAWSRHGGSRPNAGAS